MDTGVGNNRHLGLDYNMSYIPIWDVQQNKGPPEVLCRLLKYMNEAMFLLLPSERAVKPLLHYFPDQLS